MSKSKETDHEGHIDHEHSHLSDLQIRVKALETVLDQKGYIDKKVIDQIIEHFESKVGPHIGAAIIARAWVDPEFKKALLEDATSAINDAGVFGEVGQHLIAVENTPEIHNVVVCTLCSCYPWDVLGLPPVWYKSAPYRSRVVIDPRGVLTEFGTTVSDSKSIKVWDSTAETRYLVIPERPEDTGGLRESELAKLITRDSMIGTGLPMHATDEAGV
ncbi:MAG: nitrile hydratase subunit alpha [Betaproteobacteria bacterium]